MKKALLITGGTVGTGLATAERFAKEGYDVFITSRDGGRAEAAAKSVAEKYGIFSKGYQLGIRDEQAVIDVFRDIDSLGRFPVSLVLNSANLGFGADPAKGLDFFTIPMQDIQDVFDTNLVWNMMIVRQAALRMREQGGGAVVFIGSATSYRAIPNRTAYCASKGGINALSKALAVDLGPYGIRCNVVLPGTIKTERWVRMGKNRVTDGTMVPLGDISDFEDIANAAWFLGSPESKNVTGAEIVVDGGMSCQFYPTLLDELKKKAQEG